MSLESHIPLQTAVTSYFMYIDGAQNDTEVTGISTGSINKTIPQLMSTHRIKTWICICVCVCVRPCISGYLYVHMRTEDNFASSSERLPTYLPPLRKQLSLA